MSECTTTFRKYHALRLRPVIPAILLLGSTVCIVGFSLSFLHGRYDRLPCHIGLGVAGSVGLFVLAMIVHETFRQLAMLGFTRLVGTDEMLERKSAIPNILGVFVLVALSVVSNAYLWKSGLASWHSRRCMQAKQYEDALAWADEYLRFAPRSPEAYHNRAAVYFKLDKAELALGDYVRAANADQTRWDTVEVLLDHLIEYERAELFWKIYDLAQPHHTTHATLYLSTRSDLPKRPTGVPSPNEPEPKGTEPHEPDEPGQLVRRV